MTLTRLIKVRDNFRLKKLLKMRFTVKLAFVTIVSVDSARRMKNETRTQDTRNKLLNNKWWVNGHSRQFLPALGYGAGEAILVPNSPFSLNPLHLEHLLVAQFA